MDVPPQPPVAAGEVELAAGAYEQFWDSVESDAPFGDDAPRLDKPDVGTLGPVSAYDQFWDLVDV